MNERTEGFAGEARETFDRLLGRERVQDRRQDVEAEAGRDGLYVRDLQDEARGFWRDFEIIGYFGPSFPAVRFEDSVVPVALSMIAPFAERYPFRFHEPYFYEEYLYRALRAWSEETDESRTSISLEEAAERFQAGVVDFLATRIASVAHFFGSDRRNDDVPAVSLRLPKRSFGTHIKTVGFTVTVHSSAGLRIHVSPCFRINWRYFGAPSTPTVSALTGGIYRFAVDGGAYATLTPDTGQFDIPYQTLTPRLNL